MGVGLQAEFPSPGNLAEDGLALAKVVAHNCFLPHPDVVTQLPDAVWPCVRANAKLGARGTVREWDGQQVVLDDNTVPRWALLVAHGFGPNLPSGKRGWAFAHVWPEAQCLRSYTVLANLAMVVEPLSGLTDKAGPAAAFLRYHAWSQYGWKPPSRDAPEKPVGFEQIAWQYLPPTNNPQELLAGFLAKSNNAWAKLLEEII